jgi:hypothetical protein
VTVRAQDADPRRAVPVSPYASTADVPDRLTLPATLVLVAVALGLAFGGAVLVGTGGSRAKPTTAQAPALVQHAPESAIALELKVGPAVPALRVAREAKARLERSTGVAPGAATRALTVASAPVVPAGSAQPTPTAVPRDVAPAPRRVVAPPEPTPLPTPAPTPESAGDFDTTGEPATEVTAPTQNGNGAAGEAK